MPNDLKLITDKLMKVAYATRNTEISTCIYDRKFGAFLRPNP